MIQFNPDGSISVTEIKDMVILPKEQYETLVSERDFYRDTLKETNIILEKLREAYNSSEDSVTGIFLVAELKQRIIELGGSYEDLV